MVAMRLVAVLALLETISEQRGEAAEPKESAGELEEAEEVLGLLLVAHQQSTTPAQPTQGPFDHPATGWHTALGRRAPLLPDPPDVWDIPSRCQGLPSRRVVVPLVQAEVLGGLLAQRRPLHYDGIQRGSQQLGVVHVGASDHHG